MSYRARTHTNTSRFRRRGDCWVCWVYLRGVLAGMFLVFVLGGPIPAFGQQDLSFGARLSPDAMLANQLSYLGLYSLRSPTPGGRPTLAHYENGATLFDLALKLNPSDAGLWRTRADLAGLMEDLPARLKALSSYRKLEPEDDQAGWELLLAHLEGIQTLEQRVIEVERLLGLPNANLMSVALRSRLSWYVSYQALQNNDRSKALIYLKEALSLDSANIEAAQLALDLASEQKASKAMVGSFLLNLVQARPDNPKLRFLLAQTLMQQAAYEEAVTQFDAATQLTGEVTPVIEIGWATSLIATEQFEDGLDRLEALQGQLEKTVDQAENQKSQDERTKLSEPSTPTNELLVFLETLRLIALQELRRDGEARATLSRIEGLLNVSESQGNWRAKGEIVWRKIFFGKHVDQATMDGLRVDDPALVRIRGYEALMGGRVEEAKVLLEPLVIQGDYQAEYLLAREALASNPPDGLTLLKDLVAKDPGHMVSVMASLDLRKAGFRSAVTEAGRRFSLKMRSWDGILLNPDPVANAWTLLKVNVEPSRFGYLDPIKVTVTLRNTTGFALSLGNEGVLPGVLVLYITAREGGVVMQQLPPVIVSMARRLRLGPREVVEVEVALDDKPLAWLLAGRPSSPINFDIAAVYNPAFGAGDRLAVGLVGSVDHVFHLERVAMPVTAKNIKRWELALHGSDSMERMESLARFGVMGRRILSQSLSGDEGNAMMKLTQGAVDWINGSFEEFDVVSQAWFVRFVEPNSKSSALFRPVLDVARTSESPMLRIMYLARHVTDPEDVDLVSAVSSEQPEITAFAKNHRKVLLALEEAERQQEQAAVVPTGR